MSEVWMSVLESVYPVGSVYISTINTPPPSLFGFGEWEQIKDVFLLCAGDSYSGGETGGEAAHKLTVNEMPSHKHSGVWTYYGGTQYAWLSTSSGSSIQYNSFNTGASGGGQAHNNMPPYLTIYAWKRTA